MRNHWALKRSFPILAFLLLAPWPVAYANENLGASSWVEPEIRRAESESQPVWIVSGGSIGGIKRGDLFYIDSRNCPSDTKGSLYLTNAYDLKSNYRYLILEIGIYTQTNGSNQFNFLNETTNNRPNLYITLENGRVDFVIPGSGMYEITIESGSFYPIEHIDSSQTVQPVFYLTFN